MLLGVASENKELSYCRKSARLTSLCHTVQKAFQYVEPGPHTPSVSISRTCSLIMHSFSVTSANIAINDISLETRFFGLQFCRRQYRSIFNDFDVIGPKSYGNR